MSAEIGPVQLLAIGIGPEAKKKRLLGIVSRRR